MSTIARVPVAFALSCVATFACGDASAYEWYRSTVPCSSDEDCAPEHGTCNQATHGCTSGPPLRWFRPQLTVEVSTVEPAEVAWSTMRALAETAFAQWVDIAGCKVPQVDVAGTNTAATITTPTKLSDEPTNIVVFIKTTNAWSALPGTTGTQIALTYIANNPETGEIIDADMAINDAAFKFTVEDEATSGVDLRSVLTHEAGHFLGMGHSGEPGATMFATYGNDVATHARTLESDDMDGVCALYEDVPPWVDPNDPCNRCNDDERCVAGACVPGACTADCSGAVCGDDGCGGSCGTCPPGDACGAGECLEGAATFAVLRVSPSAVVFGRSTSIAIIGRGFDAGASVLLGGQALDEVDHVSAEVLTGVVPAGLELGTYSVIVTNPSGGTAVLPDAFFVVTEGDGDGCTAGGWVGGSAPMLLGWLLILALRGARYRRRRHTVRRG